MNDHKTEISDKEQYTKSREMWEKFHKKIIQVKCYECYMFSLCVNLGSYLKSKLSEDDYMKYSWELCTLIGEYLDERS